MYLSFFFRHLVPLFLSSQLDTYFQASLMIITLPSDVSTTFFFFHHIHSHLSSSQFPYKQISLHITLQICEYSLQTAKPIYKIRAYTCVLRTHITHTHACPRITQTQIHVSPHGFALPHHRVVIKTFFEFFFNYFK